MLSAVAVLAKKIWGGGPERQVNIVLSVAIISSQCKNWGGGVWTKSGGRDPPWPRPRTTTGS